nr:nicotinate-nucleotide--dimethylbenzimidazole phosphoribosyltransferase [Nitrospinaceae bacterium]
QGGLDLADESAASRTDLLAAGEMGIGNTTAASAILSVITRRPVEAVTGRGTGIDDAALNRKREVIRTALARHRPESGNPLDVLGKVGGFEIGGIAGLILGAAAARIPVVVDGLISAAGAALAVSFKDTVRDYLFLSHRSREPGHAAFYEWLGERPLLDLDLRLGEGTGAVLALTLVDAAVKVYNEMATFEEAGVSSKGELSRP